MITAWKLVHFQRQTIIFSKGNLVQEGIYYLNIAHLLLYTVDLLLHANIYFPYKYNNPRGATLMDFKIRFYFSDLLNYMNIIS